MAAPVRADLEIARYRTSVRCQAIIRWECECDAAIGWTDPVIRRARCAGFGQVYGAIDEWPGDDRPRNQMPALNLRVRASGRNRMPVRAPVTELTRRGSSDRLIIGNDTGRQVSSQEGPRAGESGVDLRVGPICVGARPAVRKLGRSGDSRAATRARMAISKPARQAHRATDSQRSWLILGNHTMNGLRRGAK
jgi:hypothetical protein